MSGQFGIRNCDSKPVEPTFLNEAATLLSPHGPDGQTVYSKHNIGIVYCAFHTTSEGRRETQPLLTGSGAVVTWDGRLDNREELIQALPELASKDSSDVAIAAAALDRWGTDFFAKLTGDWAVSVWSPRDRTLFLACDYMGIRRLYYRTTGRAVVWCTHLGPLVLLSRTSLTVNDEYVAGYLTHYPAAHLTPYREIHAVPPGGFVVIRNGSAVPHRHWTFPRHRIRYKTDAEYETHFRQVFHQAVRRRLRSDSPVLAELSGGLDSSSIVCVADDIIARGEAKTPRMDTVSYYDPRVSVGDERLYIAKVEERRGGKGHHIDTSEYGSSLSFKDHTFVVVPGAAARPEGIRSALEQLMHWQGYRVVLSGIGGDELLGGVPNPHPQLADLIVLGRPVRLAKELAAWSLVQKRPWLHLLRDALLLFLPAALRARFADQAAVPPWVDADFAQRYCLRIRQLGPQGRYGFWRPSRQDQAQTLIAMKRQLAYSSTYDLGLEDRRFPFLDQTLVEFLLSIPASQLLRPGQRRSLMRRSLAGVVPPEILSRRTKGSVARSALAGLELHGAELGHLLTSARSAKRGYTNWDRLQESLRRARNGDAPQLMSLIRTLQLEAWLRGLEEHGFASLPPTGPTRCTPSEPQTADAYPCGQRTSFYR